MKYKFDAYNISNISEKKQKANYCFKTSNDKVNSIFLLLNIFQNKIIIKISIMNEHQNNSCYVANQVLSLIDNKLWQLISLQNIKELAPQRVHLETKEMIDGFVNLSIQNKQVKNSLQQQRDPIPANIDSFSSGTINFDEGKNTISEVKNKKSLQANDSIRQKKKSSRNISEQKSNISQKSPQESISKLTQLERKQNPHQIYNKDEQKLREIVFISEKEDEEKKKRLSKREYEREQNRKKNMKILRDLKKFTFDYEGKFFGLGKMIEGKDRITKLVDRQGEVELLKKETSEPEKKTIQYEKLKDKKRSRQPDISTPLFNENGTQKFLDLFDQDDRISQGIKITALNGEESIIKQKKRGKLSGMKYQLKEYLKLTKDKKFTEFKRANSNDLTKKQKEKPIAPVFEKSFSKPKSKQFRSQRIIEIPINNKTLDHQILPPLKDKNISILKREKMSQRSINYSIKGSEKRSMINIDDEELYSVNFAKFL